MDKGLIESAIKGKTTIMGRSLLLASLREYADNSDLSLKLDASPGKTDKLQPLLKAICGVLEEYAAEARELRDRVTQHVASVEFLEAMRECGVEEWEGYDRATDMVREPCIDELQSPMDL